MVTNMTSPNSAAIEVVMSEGEQKQLLDLMTREGFHYHPDDLGLWITRLTFLYLDHQIDLGEDYTHFDHDQMAFLIRFILRQREKVPVTWKNVQ